ncbi:hypothetical protein NTHI1209_00056 [Haemophilus influenzae]|uniref:Uncharacterized protein n=1 Tax=Haemophilus influenzae TaxID=727 RepID=A0A158T0J7_HAEIF|nr:hypothetical protein NTHI1209_00056 [Haemophilus influenzae]
MRKVILWECNVAICAIILFFCELASYFAR